MTTTITDAIHKTASAAYQQAAEDFRCNRIDIATYITARAAFWAHLEADDVALAAFGVWMEQMDVALDSRLGMTTAEFDSYDFRSAFDDGAEPAEVVEDLINAEIEHGETRAYGRA